MSVRKAQHRVREGRAKSGAPLNFTLAALTSDRFWIFSGGNHMEIKMSDESLKVAASTAGGGAAGTAGSLAAVSTLGAVEGLSAADMTSGLAALGSLVGGGMAAGIGVAAGKRDATLSYWV
mgnify:CR=1 FL=1